MVSERLQHSDFLKLGFFIAALALIWNLPSLGNNLMPRNFMGWFGIIVISGLVISFSIWNGKLLFSKSLILLFIPPVAFILHGIIFPPTETMYYYMWLAFGASFTFPIYVLALMQVDSADLIWLKISNLLLLILAIQASISEFLPIFSFGRFLLNALPIELRAVSAGFQQTNLMASFLATLILWAWALRVKFDDKSSGSWVYLFVVTIPLSIVVFKTGSRTAGLGLIGGILFIVAYSYFYGNFRRSFIMIASIGTALIIQSVFLVDFSDKTGFSNSFTEVVSGSSTLIRLVFYHVSYLAGLDEWMFGHGLGNFSEAYYQTFYATKDIHSSWRHVHALAHPHNEILMHWVEMGLYGIIFIVIPVAIFLVRILFQSGGNSLILIASLLPIGIHSQTEMVLHASGFHWFLLGMVIVSLMTNKCLKVYVLPRYLLSFPIFLSLFGFWLTISTALAGENAFWNKVSADRAGNLGLHLKRLTQGDELNHWILGTETNDRIIKSMMAVALNANNKKAVAKFLPRLLDQNNRWQERDGWAQIAQAYLLLGEIDKYKSHMQKVQIFDPKYADYLEKAFDVKLESVKS